MVKTGVFIGCLPGDSKEAELLDLLKSFAKVTSIKLARGRNQTGPPFCQGYGFAMCESQRDVEILLALAGLQYRNRAIVIKAYQSGSVLKHDKGTLRKRRIFFGNVAQPITEKDLRPYFETFGSLEALYFVEQSKSMKFKYGYAVYLDSADAMRAIKGLFGVKISGNKLRIESAGNKNSSSRNNLNSGDDGLNQPIKSEVTKRKHRQATNNLDCSSSQENSTKKSPSENFSSPKSSFAQTKSCHNSKNTPTSISDLHYSHRLTFADEVITCGIRHPIRGRMPEEESETIWKQDWRKVAQLDHSNRNIRLNVVAGVRQTR